MLAGRRELPPYRFPPGGQPITNQEGWRYLCVREILIALTAQCAVYFVISCRMCVRDMLRERRLRQAEKKRRARLRTRQR
jgi:hypothetical protein